MRGCLRDPALGKAGLLASRSGNRGANPLCFPFSESRWCQSAVMNGSFPSCYPAPFRPSNPLYHLSQKKGRVCQIPKSTPSRPAVYSNKGQWSDAMKYPCPKASWERHRATETELCAQELLAWGRVFSAAGMLASNQGQAEDVRWDKLRCPAGVTGCCGLFRPRQPHAVPNPPAHDRNANTPNVRRERNHHEN